MKNFLLALMAILTTCTLAIAQNNTTIKHDSVGNVKISVKKGSKANTNNTAVTVIGVDTADADSAEIDDDSNSVSHGSTCFSIDTDSDDFPFNKIENTIDGGILLAIVAIVAVFGLPVFILFVIFFFRYKTGRHATALPNRHLPPGSRYPRTLSAKTDPSSTNAH